MKKLLALLLVSVMMLSMSAFALKAEEATPPFDFNMDQILVDLINGLFGETSTCEHEWDVENTHRCTLCGEMHPCWDEGEAIYIHNFHDDVCMLCDTNLHCGLEGHEGHTLGACGIPGHYTCDGKDHGFDAEGMLACLKPEEEATVEEEETTEGTNGGSGNEATEETTGGSGDDATGETTGGTGNDATGETTGGTGDDATGETTGGSGDEKTDETTGGSGDEKTDGGEGQGEASTTPDDSNTDTEQFEEEKEEVIEEKVIEEKVIEEKFIEDITELTTELNNSESSLDDNIKNKKSSYADSNWGGIFN